jgi:hypothetical protein
MLLACLHCYTVVQVLGEEEEIASLVGSGSEYWPDDYTCVNCGKGCTAVPDDIAVLDLQKFKLRELSAPELLAALHGLGTPEEMKCNAATISALFATKIQRVQGEVVRNTERYALDYIEFEGGARAYFGSSPSGAVIYRITHPHSYVRD